MDYCEMLELMGLKGSRDDGDGDGDEARMRGCRAALQLDSEPM
jgi:hypothetical protein